MEQTGENAIRVLEVNQAVAEHSANAYLRDVLGSEYHVGDVLRRPETWRFLVRCHYPGLDGPIPAGHLQVDAATGAVLPLSGDELQELRERGAVRAARERGEVARDENGAVLPYLAKIRVNGYLSGDVVFFAQAEGRPTWVPGAPPRWRVTTVLNLPKHGRVCELGTVDVDALTGEVIPLTEAQIKSMQRKASDAAARAQRSAAAAG